MTQTDWHRLIDTSFDGGPEVEVTPRDALRDGHRALRRRRVRVGGLAGGAVLMTALLASAVATLPSDPDAPITRAGDPGSAATPPDSPAVDDPGPDNERPAETREVYRTAVGPLYLDRETGDLLLPDEWRELDRILDPFGPGSIALEITDGGPSLYLLATTGGERGMIVIAQPGKTTLKEFVASSRDDFERLQREDGGE